MTFVTKRCRLIACACLAVSLVGCGTNDDDTPARNWVAPPANAQFDYQIDGDYPPPTGTRVVIRDWFAGQPAPDLYSICYVNGFQTQADEPAVDRPDERGNWPPDLVLQDLGDDPNWGGEYLIDISTDDTRRRATAWVAAMLDTCGRKGFRGVEIDNLDSWTRFDDTPLAGRVPFGQADAEEYARLLTKEAHRRGLAVGQKNTPQLDAMTSRQTIGFDFAVAEECGRFAECDRYRSLFGASVLDVEYDASGYRAACIAIGSQASVVQRDRDVTRPDSPTYRYSTC